ncbi:MAG: OmpA family protein [Myxococcota bacterium]
MIALFLAAQAQTTSPEINGQLFRPSMDARQTLWTDDSTRSPNGTLLARAVLHYANRPVVFLDQDGNPTPIVRDVVQLSALAAYSRGPVRIGVDVPVYLRSGGIEGGETGLGDVGAELKLTMADRNKAPIGLALLGRVTAPTTTVAASLGNRGFGWEVSAVVDREFGPLLVAANIGTRGLPDTELENFEWSDQLQGRLGLGLAVSPNGGLSLDVGTNVNYANVVPGATPAEAILGGYGRLTDSLVLRGGVGSGITTGFGAPRFRVISGLAYEPAAEQDADADGILDKDDACPRVPEDPDGFEDLDGCPEGTPVMVRLVDPDGKPVDGRWMLEGDTKVAGGSGEGASVEAGAYTLEAFAKGYGDVERSVEVPEGASYELVVELTPNAVLTQLTVSVTDEEGAPIPEARWAVVGGLEGQPPGETVDVDPGDLTVEVSAPGYRLAKQEVSLKPGDTSSLVFVLAKARAEVTASRIEIKDSIYFETAKAIIKAESHDLLDEVAEVLQAHPEILRVRIEGHTDSRGSATYNLKLSDDRAASVRNYLIQRGVEGARLDSVGFGESHPLVQGETEEAWANNRRVDFFVVERSE